MPYVIRFTRPVQITDRDRYFNDCCVGGDIVLERLLLPMRERYGIELKPDQEDWGWFVWFGQAGIKLAVDVHTEDHMLWKFQLQLTSRRPRFLLGDKVHDTPELEQLRELVIAQLRSWPVEGLSVEREAA
jgi:hypothetical protein